MMIAARLAGGNLFFCHFWVGDLWWGFLEHSEHSEHSDFFWVGDFWSTRSTRMIFQGGGGVLDCKCWK